MKRKLILLATLLALSSPGWGTTIVDTYVGIGNWFIGNHNSIAVAWTVSSTYQNVTVAAALETPYPGPQAGVAYLAPSGAIGPVLSAPFTFPAAIPLGIPFQGVPWTDLFTNLTLFPGTYYLTVTSATSPGGGWGLAPYPYTGLGQTGPGVTIGSTYFGAYNSGPFLGPQTAGYSDVSAFARAAFQVTANNSVVSATPEPPTYIAAFGVALIGIAGLGRRRLLAQLASIRSSCQPRIG